MWQVLRENFRRLLRRPGCRKSFTFFVSRLKGVFLLLRSFSRTLMRSPSQARSLQRPSQLFCTKKKSTNANFWVRMSREGVGVKKFGMSLEMVGYPGKIAGISLGAQKTRKNVCACSGKILPQKPPFGSSELPLLVEERQLARAGCWGGV